jgi:hypothetical protein
MSTTYYIVLLVLLVVILIIASPNLRQLAATGICFWLFLICLIASGTIGLLGGVKIAVGAIPGESGYIYAAPPSLLAWPFFMSLTSVATFSVLYYVGALSIIRVIEKTQKVEFAKPGIKTGLVSAAVSPYFMVLVVKNFHWL